MRVSNSFREDEVRGAVALFAQLDRDPAHRVLVQSEALTSLRRKLLLMRAKFDAQE